jgi:hypothetical protein
VDDEAVEAEKDEENDEENDNDFGSGSLFEEESISAPNMPRTRVL